MKTHVLILLAICSAALAGCGQFAAIHLAETTVLIDDPGGQGSGVIIDIRNLGDRDAVRILTVAHGIDADSTPMLTFRQRTSGPWRAVGLVEWRDRKSTDLAILVAYLPAGVACRTATIARAGPEFGEPLFASCYPSGTYVLKRGLYVGAGRSDLYAMVRGTFCEDLSPGASGGGIFNRRGELVGILQAWRPFVASLYYPITPGLIEGLLKPPAEAPPAGTDERAGPGDGRP